MQIHSALAENKHWQYELKHALKNYADIAQFFELPLITNLNYSCHIPRKFAEKIKNMGENSPLWKQFVPTVNEQNPLGLIDPIGDLKMAKGHGIIQRYKSRILFTPTPFCPIICRYCFRKNELSSHDEIFNQSTQKLKEYLASHPEINEVILTGGDPLMLNNNKLIQLLELLSFTGVKFIRFHTRTPIILPSRINEGLIKLLQNFSNKFSKIIFVLHTNHSDEIDSEVQKSLLKLKELNIHRLTQTVLLKDVNNTKNDLLHLFYKILECDFTPYYLHHPDKVKGAMHFWLPLEEGRKIYARLRDELPGWAIPHYIIDHPSGHGKQLAFNPESYNFSGKFLNKDGDLLTY